jgi:hypothetical protein
MSPFPSLPAIAPSEAVALITAGHAPDGLNVSGGLRWSGKEVAPRLPNGLTCSELHLEGVAISELPAGLSVQFRLTLKNCTRLHSLPDGLRAGAIDLSGCTGLSSLPEGLSTYFLDISGCRQLTRWPVTGELSVGRLRARDCTGLTGLPDWLGPLSQLDLRGCANIQELPEWLEIASWIDVGGTSITSLPESLSDVPLRWRGVPVDHRVAFRPGEISAAEILAEPNAELRRVKLERMGLDQFLEQADAEVLDEDRDVGGPRRLLRVPMQNDEPLVCVIVSCPSTARQYIIRVPPATATCRHAIAWTAGFDDPELYQPLIET